MVIRPIPNFKLRLIDCGQGWIRTSELRREQIYSLLPLATWLLALVTAAHYSNHEPEKGLEPPTS